MLTPQRVLVIEEGKLAPGLPARIELSPERDVELALEFRLPSAAPTLQRAELVVTPSPDSASRAQLTLRPLLDAIEAGGGPPRVLPETVTAFAAGPTVIRFDVTHWVASALSTARWGVRLSADSPAGLELFADRAAPRLVLYFEPAGGRVVGTATP